MLPKPKEIKGCFAELCNSEARFLILFKDHKIPVWYCVDHFIQSIKPPNYGTKIIRIERSRKFWEN